MKLILSKLITKAYTSEGFISALIFGPQGIGKTSYALHVAKEIYGSWRKALEHLFFNPKEAIDKLYSALEQEKRIPLIIMDDAGLWLGKSQWWKKEKIEFAEFFDIIRTVCSAVIFTTPADNLISRLSHEIQLRIKVSPIDSELYSQLKRQGYNIDVNNWRVAKIYRFSLSPLFQPIIKKQAYDIYPLRYPSDIKALYDKKRQEAVKQKLDRVKQSLKLDTAIIINKANLDELILQLLEQGYSKAEIAKKLGISRATVYNRLKKLSKVSNF
jgi:hypothetical protein